MIDSSTSMTAVIKIDASTKINKNWRNATQRRGRGLNNNNSESEDEFWQYKILDVNGELWPDMTKWIEKQKEQFIDKQK